jgi:Pellino
VEDQRNVAYGEKHPWAEMFLVYGNRDRRNKRVNRYATLFIWRFINIYTNVSNLILQIKEESNVLQDGTLIDLCGATLLWRSAEGLQNSPVSYYHSKKYLMIN